MVAANRTVNSLIAAVDPELLKPPVNVMRLNLHSRGLAPMIVNLAEWRAHLLDRLRRQHRLTLDPAVGELLKELSGFRRDADRSSERSTDGPIDAILVPLKLSREPACCRCSAR